MIKHLILLKIENMMNINGTSMVYKFFDNFFISSSHANTSGGAVTRANKFAIKIEIMSNQNLSDLARVAEVSESTRKLRE